MAEASNRRRGLFIDKGFQSRFIGLALVLIVTISIGSLVLWFSSAASRSAAEQIADKGSISFGIVLLFILILVLVIATVVYGLRFSHRIVGPVYAFNRHLNWIKEGNYTRDIKLRDKDEFLSLAQTFNAMQSTLRRRSRSHLETMERMQSMIDEIKTSLDAETIDMQTASSAIESLAKEVNETHKLSEGLLVG